MLVKLRLFEPLKRNGSVYSEKDAQMCIYHVSWQSNFGFCCELDEECARELAGEEVSVYLKRIFSAQGRS